MHVRCCIFCVLLCGVPVSALGIFSAAVLASAVDLPAALLPVLAELPVMLGTFLAAYRAGKRERRRGMRCGLRCGILLSGGWYLLAGSSAGFGIPVCMLVSVPCGICGGILGVSRPAPAIHRRMHTLRRIPETAALHGAHAAAVRRTKHLPKDSFQNLLL